MTLLKNAELWYPRLIPSRPNKKFSRENPTWEIQIRTTDPDVRKRWEAQGIRLKGVIPDEGEPYWKTTIKKKIYKRDGSDNDPVEVKAGNLREIDPATIGNGSEGHVRLLQYEYEKPDGGGKQMASVLMGVQLTKLKKRKPKARDDDFTEEDMEIIEEDDEDEDVDEGGEEAALEEEEVEEKPEKKAPSAPSKRKFN